MKMHEDLVNVGDIFLLKLREAVISTSLDKVRYTM